MLVSKKTLPNAHPSATRYSIPHQGSICKALPKLMAGMVMTCERSGWASISPGTKEACLRTAVCRPRRFRLQVSHLGVKSDAGQASRRVGTGSLGARPPRAEESGVQCRSRALVHCAKCSSKWNQAREWRRSIMERACGHSFWCPSGSKFETQPASAMPEGR